MSGQVKLFAQACIDPRFRPATQDFLEKKFGLKPTEYDLKTDAGGIKEIANGTPVGEWLIANAQIGYDKHGARIFVLCNHADCAYYGGSKNFSGLKEEHSVHGDDLRKASKIYLAKFPDVKIYSYLVSKEEKPTERFIFQQIV